MNIYKISQMKNTEYDSFDAAIVCAENPTEAKNICPSRLSVKDTWVEDSRDVDCELIGTTETHTEGVILASFNAG